LAFLVAREVGHVALGHLRDRPAGAPPVFDRDQELAADRYGAELMLNAGFSYRAAAQGVARLLGPGPGHALAATAPAVPPWSDRAENLRRRQADLGRSMSAFHSGVRFLAAGQHRLAEECFQRVARECPGCADAWLNLGA